MRGTAMGSQENAVDSARGFCKVVFDYSDKMPRERKFIVGDRLAAIAIQLLELTVTAYYSPRAEKAATIKKANIHSCGHRVVVERW